MTALFSAVRTSAFYVDYASLLATTSHPSIYIITIINHLRLFRSQQDVGANANIQRGKIAYMPIEKPLIIKLPFGLRTMTINTARLVSPIQVLATFGPSVLWSIQGALKGALWVVRLASGEGLKYGPSRGGGMVFPLPELPFGGDQGGRHATLFKACIRFVASAALWVVFSHGLRAVKELRYQTHFIGIRERPEVITTGPYSCVRHPLYGDVGIMHRYVITTKLLVLAFRWGQITLRRLLSVMITQTLLYSAIFWSYVPLWSTAINLVAFWVKIPIEEELLENNEKTGVDYRRYKERVRYRLLPYIW